MDVTTAVRNLISGFPERVFLKDRQGKYLLASSSYAAGLGRDASDLEGVDDYSLYPREIAEAHHTEEYSVWAHSTVSDSEEEVFESDPPLWVRIKRSLISDEKGEAVALLGIVNDITDQKRMAERLERSAADFDQFVYVVSHDLHEPLRMVASFSELLAERYAGRLDEKADTYIRYSVDGARRMQQMLTDLVAFSRITTRGRPFQPTDCASVVSDVSREFDDRFESSGGRLVAGDLPVLMADPGQLAEIFRHLIENALTFRREDPPVIEITSKRRGRFWELAVTDNGLGIAPEFHDRIFMIFQRLHERDRYPGRGVGLAMVKRIVERHGGQTRVESAPQAGSTFRFTIPAAG